LPVVLLTVDIKGRRLAHRVQRDRPLLAGNPRAQWLRLMEKRRGLYEEVAVATVRTDGRSPDEVAADVAAIGGCPATRC